MEHGVYGNLILIFPKPYSIYLRGTIEIAGLGMVRGRCGIMRQDSRLFGKFLWMLALLLTENWGTYFNSGSAVLFRIN